MRWMLMGFAVLVAALAGLGCSDCENWEDMGLCLDFCDSLTLPAAVQADDTLRIGYFGEGPGTPYLTFSHVEVNRAADRLELRIWAQARRWLGECGTPPPPGPVGVHGEHSEPPPWPGDSVLVRLHQPEAPPLDYWVQVLR